MKVKVFFFLLFSSLCSLVGFAFTSLPSTVSGVVLLWLVWDSKEMRKKRDEENVKVLLAQDDDQQPNHTGKKITTLRVFWVFNFSTFQHLNRIEKLIHNRDDPKCLKFFHTTDDSASTDDCLMSQKSAHLLMFMLIHAIRSSNDFITLSILLFFTQFQLFSFVCLNLFHMQIISLFLLLAQQGWNWLIAKLFFFLLLNFIHKKLSSSHSPVKFFFHKNFRKISKGNFTFSPVFLFLLILSWKVEKSNEKQQKIKFGMDTIDGNSKHGKTKS